ncbi:retinitis pigmentosa 9 protein isoform X1 [Ovis aries]|uniref:RP9 pre-mRNA splicing factor n=1 Tax=Ovis aries TaxID=9940 RepID=A0AC11E575_SHEEP|nr:retinitis pigmentosa 9 protein isoform X1 [Ovis aries]
MSSRPGRDDAGAGGARRPREPPEQELQRRRELKRRRQDAQQLQQLKHLESFYEKPPPGFIKEDETKPEDCIPDVPGNEHAREFLAHAPTKGLWMPLGKEVKVMQCWRCKRMETLQKGFSQLIFQVQSCLSPQREFVAHEDPMYDIIRENKRHEKDIRIQQLKQLLEDSTSDDDGSSSSSSEDKEKHKKKKKKEKHKKKKKEKKKKKKRKHKSSKSNESSDSE